MGIAALIMTGGGINEVGAPAIAVAVTNVPMANSYSWAAPSCTAWTLVEMSTFESAAVETAAFRRVLPGPTAVYFHQCGQTYSYTYVDTGKGQIGCLADPAPHRSFPSWPALSAVVPCSCG
ncbi:MAG: hypothetical protein ABI949_00330 [Ilumatobacteraceae bacterium]